MKHLLHTFLLGGLLIAGSSVVAQTVDYTITGTVWKEARSSENGTFNEAVDTRLPGIIVEAYETVGFERVGIALTKQDGTYAIDLKGVEAGDYYLKLVYPSQGAEATVPGTPAAGQITNTVTDNNETNWFLIEEVGSAEFNFGLKQKTDYLLFCTSNPMTHVNYDVILNLPKAASSTMGNATIAHLFLTAASEHPSVGVENTSTSSVNDVEIEFSGRLSYWVNRATDPGNTATNYTRRIQAASSLLVSLDAYDGTIDFGGTSGMRWYDFNSVDYSENTNITGSPLNNIYKSIDEATFPIYVKAASAVTIGGGANMNTEITTLAQAGACVTYYFEDGVLPVQFINFDVAKTAQNTAVLSWSTANEENNKGFTVERSNDGTNYTEIGFVKTNAPEGNSTTQLNYSFTDVQPASGINYYRLKQTDLDGSIAYSIIRNVLFGNATNVVVYPNPAKDVIYINTDISKIESVVVTNLSGKNVLTLNRLTQNAINVGHLAKGVYIIQFFLVDGSKNVQQVIIN